jgi:gamma-glutamyl hercynylcysteine S-oxide hydrolase
MCRHLAYLGPPRTLASLLYEPPHSLQRQSWAPRHQPEGSLMNADGWGVGWWDHEVRPEPARYRTTTPMWADRSFRSSAEVVRSEAIVAAVRSATPPLPIVETSNAPFTTGSWLFSLNGYISGFAGPVGVGLRHAISDDRAVGMEGVTDSEVLFGLTLDRLDDDRTPAEALAEVIAAVVAVTPGRLNLLLSDGESIVATTCGASLFTLQGGPLARDGVLVASEPLDDDPDWERVPDLHLLEASPKGVELSPLGIPEDAAL